MDQPPVFVAYLIVAVFLAIVWVLLTFVLNPNIPRARGGGLRFYFLPLRWLYLRPSWAKKFDTAEVDRFVADYARVMPEAYQALGVKVTGKDIEAHAKKVKCLFRRGFLRSRLHELHGLTDMNNDGEKDKYTGLTHSVTKIEVAVLDEMLTDDGRVDVPKTAFSYELHNAFIQRFAGYPVAAGESHVDKNDESLQRWLEGKKMADLKRQREVLDAMWKTIK